MTGASVDSKGSPVLVTGASHGLGLAVSGRLAKEGCHLAICARDGSRLSETASALRADQGVDVFSESVDVTDHAALASFVERAATHFGRLQGLVLSVGGNRGRGLAESSSQDWLDTFDLNVVHAVTAIRTAVDAMPSGASVVLVSSVSGWKPSPPAQYAVSKAALIHLAACLAQELGPRGIRVNTVCPGSMLIEGKRWDRMRVEEPERFAEFEKEFPAGHLVDPDDVASVIAFLLSDQSRAINGACIPVDGGQLRPSPDGY